MFNCADPVSKLYEMFISEHMVFRLVAGVADDRYEGAISNAIAAYLQTKGLVDQAAILSQFKDTLIIIAALFWLYSIALAIGAVGVFGSYRQGVYLLLGPAFFYFMIESKVVTNGTELRFGNYTAALGKGEQSEMLKHIRAIEGSGGTTREVSRFFGLYDTLVSEVVHDVVALLISTETKDHLRYIARERMLHFVLSSIPDHGGFVRLFATHHGECGPLMDKQQRSTFTRLQGPVRHYNYESQLTAEGKYRSLLQYRTVPLDYESKAFVLSLKESKVAGFEAVDISEISQPLIVSCETLWKFMMSASRLLAQRRMTKEAMFNFFRGDTSDLPWEEIVKDVNKVLAAGFLGVRTPEEKARDRIAAQVYKNTVHTFSLNQLGAQAFARSPFAAQEHEGVTRLLAKAEGHGGMMGLKYFAGTIPYVQGIFLYLLSIAFPFFAVFLVVPSRASTFFAWMGMWAWVKSWDIGFAIVHVARDVLWRMMSTTINQHQQELNLEDPMSVMAVVYNNDPFYSQNTYWIVVSILTVSVPFITAHFCLGATGMFNAFSGTIDQTARRFGTSERAISRRFMGNVTEHIQRTMQARMSFAYSLATLNQAEQGKKAAEAGKLNIDEGATTMSGKPLAQGLQAAVGIARIGSAQMSHVASSGDLATTLGTLSTSGFIAEAEATRGNAVRNNQSNLLRGMIPFSAPLAPQVKGKDGNLSYDLSAPMIILGDQDYAQELAEKGVTWGQTFVRSSESQVDPGNAGSITNLIAETGRRMAKAFTGAESGATAFATERTNQELLMRSPLAKSQAARGALVWGWLFESLGKPPNKNDPD